MTIFSITRADFLQRVQAPKFGLILLFLAFLTFLMFPSANAKYAVISVFGYRGLYDSAWVGDTLAVINGLVLPLFAFYFIKTAINLDRFTQTDALLKASGVSNFSYIMGKWLSNLALLGTFVLLMNVVAIIKQMYLGESYTINLFTQFHSQIYVAFPALMLTASFALFFESIPGLRSGFGNLIFMYVWMPLMIVSMEYDVGVGEVMNQMEAAARELGKINGNVNVGGSTITEPLATFVWQGTEINSGNIMQGSLYMVAISIGVLFVTWLLFAHQRKGFKVPNPFKRKKKPQIETAPINIPTTLPPLAQSENALGILQLLLGELRFIMRARGWIWYGGLALILALPFTLPAESMLHVLVPIAGMWAVFAHSELGCRDVIHDTTSLMQSTVFGQSQRLFTSWIAAVTIQLLVFSGLIINFAVTGQGTSAIALLVGALFIPTLALFLGQFSSTSRTFEFIYMLIWYAGPIDKTPALDFLGTTIETAAPPTLTFAVITLILLMASLSMERITKSVGEFGSSLVRKKS